MYQMISWRTSSHISPLLIWWGSCSSSPTHHSRDALCVQGNILIQWVGEGDCGKSFLSANGAKWRSVWISFTIPWVINRREQHGASSSSNAKQEISTNRWRVRNPIPLIKISGECFLVERQPLTRIGRKGEDTCTSVGGTVALLLVLLYLEFKIVIMILREMKIQTASILLISYSLVPFLVWNFVSKVD